MMKPTPITSRSVAASSGEFGSLGRPTRTDLPYEAKPMVERVRRQVPPTERHWLEGLEPYEGKLSSTVLRGGRAGNSPLPLDSVRVTFFENILSDESAEQATDCQPCNPCPGCKAGDDVAH